MYKINSKKALAAAVVAGIIIAIVAGVIVLIVYAQFVGGIGAESTFPDTMCRVNANIVDKVPSPAKGTLKWIFCVERDVTINAKNWDKCKPEFKTKYENPTTDDSEKEAIKACASEQIAGLAERCWYMYGEGKWKLGGIGLDVKEPCFKFKVYNLNPYELKKKDVAEQLNTNLLKKDKINWEECSVTNNKNWGIFYAKDAIKFTPKTSC